MKQTNQSLIIYYRSILKDKDSTEFAKEHARKQLMKILKNKNKIVRGSER